MFLDDVISNMYCAQENNLLFYTNWMLTMYVDILLNLSNLFTFRI